MKKYFILAWILFISAGFYAQPLDNNTIDNNIINLGEVTEGNEYFEGFESLDSLLEGVEIVMLGEQSHGEGTAYDTKIKLIKYLHKELGFDLLAFESGFYDCKKAWEQIEEGEEVRDAMGKSIFSLWSTTHNLKSLADYLEETKNSDSPLKLCGFDNQLAGKYSNTHLLHELEAYLNQVKPEIISTEGWKNFCESISLLTSLQFKELKKEETKVSLLFTQDLINDLNLISSDKESKFWIQTLKSAKANLSDIGLKTEFRDKQMAENLIWIKETYPESKIICWGATSHFLYNSTTVRMKSPLIQILGGNTYKSYVMMGHYIKNKYQDKVYTIGFTAHHGEYGLWRSRELKTPKEETLEYLLAHAKHDNFLLPLNKLNLSGVISRPLGNFYMKNDIHEVMDAVIFNREMIRPKLDNNFFLKIYPENKYIKPVPVDQ